MLLSLANELKVLPTDLNRLLIIVVVLSMALTPFLAEAGKRFAESTAPEDGIEGAWEISIIACTASSSFLPREIVSGFICPMHDRGKRGLLTLNTGQMLNIILHGHTGKQYCIHICFQALTWISVFMKERDNAAGGTGAGGLGADAEPAEMDSQAVVICGFGELGQTLANMLESPLAMSLERGRVPYVAFDLQPSRLRSAHEAGFNVFYGDASRPAVCPPIHDVHGQGFCGVPFCAAGILSNRFFSCSWLS